MSEVQEAASLFGSGQDEGSDPFGYVVNPSSNSIQESSPFSPPPASTNTNSTSAQGEVTGLNTHDYQPADNLFGGEPSDDADDLFGAGGTSESDWLATGSANADAGGTQGEYLDYSSYANAGSLGTIDQSQGWSGNEQPQQQQPYQAYGNTYQSSYDPQNQYAVSSSYQPPAQNSGYSAQGYNYGRISQYTAYASPQQNTTHLKSATWNPTPDAHDPYRQDQAATQSNLYSSSTQSAYDPYKPSTVSNPPTQSTYDPYKPQVQQVPPVHTTHDPYRPTVQASSSIQSRSTPAHGALSSYPSSYAKPPVPPVPAPPRVIAESFRTSTSNAYDPPMLPTKTKRHVSGWGSTMTTPAHAPPFPPPSPTVSNPPLAPPPRKDSALTGPQPRADTSSAGPPPHRINSPAHQSSVRSPGLPPPPSRPSSRQVTRGTGVPHPPPPLPPSKQTLQGPPVQSPQQHVYTHQRVDSPDLGTQRNWTASPEHTMMRTERSPERSISQSEQSPTGQDEVPFDNYDYGDPETLAVDASESPPITDIHASTGLPWDREGGPSPSTARQSDYVPPEDNEVGDAKVADIPKPEEHPVTPPHSRTSSYGRPRANGKFVSPPRQTAPPHDPYKPTDPTVQHPPPVNQAVLAPTHTAPYDPYKPTVSSTPGSVPVSTPSSPLVSGHGSRPGSLRSSLESTRPHLSQYDHPPPVRTSSSASIRSQPGTHVSSALKSEYGSSSRDPYVPSNRMRSATNGTISSITSDAYAPRRQSSEAQDHTPYAAKFGHPDRPSSRTDSFLTSSTYPTYAPSPSLLGTNDPLGRSSARVPVISFGFAGKVVTCFHGADMSSAGFDVALSSRQSREIQIRSLHKLIPQSALEDTSVTYPGPLFGDSGSPTVSLVRGASTQTKTKKAKVLKYLEDRISELSNVVAYASAGLLERGRSEGKLALFSLIRVLVENDGKLSGSPEIDKAVRAALVPRLGHDTDSDLAKFATPADGFGASGSLASNETPISITTLKPSALEKIQEFLIRGERRQACHYALDEKLWAHAMVIASSIDRDAWQEAVKEFIRSELGSGDAQDEKMRTSDSRRGSLLTPKSDGRESLRVAYSLFAGQGATSVQAMLPPAPLSRTADNKLTHPPPTPLGTTPMSSSFPGNAPTNIPVEVLAKWPETVAMMIHNSTSSETSSALSAIGDHLSANQWIEAAHICYLLSPQTSQLGGLGTPTTRLVLVGSANPAVSPTFSKDPDPMILSEIVEFSYSLSAPQKGQEPFPGLPHLQSYRLIRAHQLAELGHVQLATRYCDAITASVNRASIYFTPTFLVSLRDLSARLIAAPSLDKSGSWIAGGLGKPSLDKVGGWLGGQFTKFIAGEGDSSPAEEQKPGLAQGPFSHYSSISTTELQSSHTSPRAATPNHYSSVAPPRTGSAVDLRTMTGSPHVPVNRSSSAMDHVRPLDRRSPVQRLASAGASTTNFSAPPTSTYRTNGINGYGHRQQTSSGLTSGENSPSTANDEHDGSSRSPWWDSLKSSDTQTPTATTFQQQSDENTGNFISLMDDIPMPSIPSSHRGTPQPVREEEEEEDLGFGNNASKKQVPSGDGGANRGNGSAATEKKDSQPPPKIEASKSEGDKPSSGSWLSRWWKKEGTGPIKANLGEETAFYYDKELKRWVNKKNGAETPKPSPPPPPLRAQTTSPGKMEKPPPSPGNLPPPPPRPASAVDLSSPPRKVSSRIRSNLAPDNTQSVPSTPASHETGFLQPPIPPTRPRSQASKKNVRSRYVDVFQQSNPTSPAPPS